MSVASILYASAMCTICRPIVTVCYIFGICTYYETDLLKLKRKRLELPLKFICFLNPEFWTSQYSPVVTKMGNANYFHFRRTISRRKFRNRVINQRRMYHHKKTLNQIWKCIGFDVWSMTTNPRVKWAYVSFYTMKHYQRFVVFTCSKNICLDKFLVLFILHWLLLISKYTLKLLAWVHD